MAGFFGSSFSNEEENENEAKIVENDNVKVEEKQLSINIGSNLECTTQNVDFCLGYSEKAVLGAKGEYIAIEGPLAVVSKEVKDFVLIMNFALIKDYINTNKIVLNEINLVKVDVIEEDSEDKNNENKEFITTTPLYDSAKIIEIVGEEQMSNFHKEILATETNIHNTISIIGESILEKVVDEIVYYRLQEVTGENTRVAPIN